MARKKVPELTFQQHIADFLTRVHGYAVLEQSDIGDIEHCRRPSLVLLKQIKQAGQIVGIELLDQIIFNRQGYYSFLEEGCL